MNALFTEPFLVSLLFGAVTAGLPLLLAGLGEQISEKAGVLNIGLEGMMLLGAYTGFLATYHTGSFWLGFLAGGVYHYEGHADATNYFSTYSCKYDHGTFQMSRP